MAWGWLCVSIFKKQSSHRRGSCISNLALHQEALWNESREYVISEWSIIIAWFMNKVCPKEILVKRDGCHCDDFIIIRKSCAVACWVDSLFRPPSTIKVFNATKGLMMTPMLLPIEFHSVIQIKFSHNHDDVIKWKHFPHYWPFVRWIPLTKASDAELWCFLWSAPE